MTAADNHTTTGTIAMQRLLILTLVLIVSGGLFAAREVRAGTDRMFSGFARNIVDGLNAAKLASLPAVSGYGPPRIAVRTVNRNGGAAPDAKSAGYTRRMLGALQEYGNGRFGFVALDALDGLIRDIKAAGLPADEAKARIRDLRANAQADILVAGTVTTDETGTYLSYQAVSTSTGELLASTPVAPLRPVFRSTVVRADAAIPAQPRQRSIVAEAEQMLFDRGYDPGPIDGTLTAQTRAALRAYQLNSALPVNGRLTRRVVNNLRRDSRRAVF